MDTVRWDDSERDVAIIFGTSFARLVIQDCARCQQGDRDPGVLRDHRLLISLWTGRKPTLPTCEMICLYFGGWASLEELIEHIRRLKPASV